MTRSTSRPYGPNSTMRHRPPRKGVTLVEVMIAAVIMAAVLFPVYWFFVRSKAATTKSAMAYLAIQVAREELQEVRTMPLWGVPARPATSTRPEIPEIPPYTGHDWQPVAGKRIFHISASDDAELGPLLSRLQYPGNYQGIETRVAVIPPQGAAEGDPEFERVRMIQLEVRWTEKGQAVGGTGGQEGTQLFRSVVVRRGVL